MKPQGPKVQRRGRMKKAREIKDLTGPYTLEDLKRIEGKATQVRTHFPDTLSLGEIGVADKVFQWRNASLNIVADELHTRYLMGIVAEGRELDAVLVMPIGDRVFLVDGHHRLTAYHSQGWKLPVPVTWFRGTIEQGADQALRENSKGKLPMSRQERDESAWTLAKRPDGNQPGGMSKSEISILTSVPRSTIAKMRKLAREDPEGTKEMTWREAQRRAAYSKEPNHEWRSDKVAEFAELIKKHLYKAIGQYPDLFCEALEGLIPELPYRMIDGSWYDHAYAVIKASPPETRGVDLDI